MNKHSPKCLDFEVEGQQLQLFLFEWPTLSVTGKRTNKWHKSFSAQLFFSQHLYRSNFFKKSE